MLYLASDHAGFILKEKLKRYFKTKGILYVDCGAKTYKKDDDYPIYIARAVRCVSKNFWKHKGIIIGASGQGEAIVANRFRGVRAVVYYGGPYSIITFSRRHNDANILSLGARFISEQTAKKAVTMWLDTRFLNESRHSRRIKQIRRLSP